MEAAIKSPAWDIWNNTLNPVLPKPVSIIEFAEGEEYCRLKLYPHQRLILKLYNNEALDEWEQSILKNWHRLGYTVPDIFQRLENKPEGEGFHEAIFAIGRRGSKSLMAAIISLYETYKLLLKDNPHKYYNILEGEPIQVACVADTSSQAGETIFAKIHALCLRNKWMLNRRPPGEERDSFMAFQTNEDRRQAKMLWDERGIKSSRASVVLKSYSANSGSARGRAIIVVVFDEIAHYQNRQGRDNAYNLYEALTPSTTDFGDDGKIVSISSPKYKFGMFFDLYSSLWSGKKQNAIGFQIPSWEMYDNAERVGLRPRFTLEQLKHDSETIEYGTPEWWREYGAKFQENVSIYFNPNHVNRMFKLGEEIGWDWQDQGGSTAFYYHMHGDPAKNHAGFPLVVAHYDPDWDKVFIDWAWRWKVRQKISEGPLDKRETIYKQGSIIDYDDVEDKAKWCIDHFFLRTISFDQWNSIGSIQHLKKYAVQRGVGDILRVFEDTFTGRQEYRAYEKVRKEMADERIVSPYWPILHMELNNVIDNGGKITPPDIGPVTTKDAADCMVIAANRALEDAEKGRTDRRQVHATGTIGQFGGVPMKMPSPGQVRGRF